MQAEAKRLWHRCFLVNSAKFLRARFYGTPPGDCFYVYICYMKIRYYWRDLVPRQSSNSKFWEAGKVVLKIYSKFTGKHPCRSVISVKLQQLYWNHTPAWVLSCRFAVYFQNTSGRLLLDFLVFSHVFYVT